MNPEEITSLDVSIAASKGDALANRIYEFTGQILGEACSDFMAFSSSLVDGQRPGTCS